MRRAQLNFNTGKSGCVFVSSESADEADAKLFGFGGGSASAKPSSSTLDKEIIYKMDRSTRGIAVIINNKNFLRSSGMDRYPRNGTDVDRDSLVKLFRMLKFEVKIYNDRTKAEIRTITKEMATLNHSNYDAFIFSILTHGEEGVIYGTDGTISIRDLTAEFKYSTSLAGKPKLFFFQACQGKKINTYHLQAALLVQGMCCFYVEYSTFELHYKEKQHEKSSSSECNLSSWLEIFLGFIFPAT